MHIMDDNKNRMSGGQGDDNIYVYPEGNDGNNEPPACADTPQNGEDEGNAGLETYYSGLDQSGPNYSQAERGEDEGRTDGDGKRDKSAFLMMLKVLFNPVEGWKSIRRYKLTAEESQRGCYYPLLAFLAVSKFAAYIHAPRVTLNDVVVDAVAAFVSFFFGYFCIMILLDILMPGGVKETVKTEFGKVFVIMSLSTLCLFFSLLDIFPMLWAALIFLPLWTIYVICRGVRFFKFPEERKISCTAIMCFLIVGVPNVLDWLLTKILS